jgi:hypothetical protein
MHYFGAEGKMNEANGTNNVDPIDTIIVDPIDTIIVFGPKPSCYFWPSTKWT